MFGKTFPLFRAFGIQVQADLSWLIIVVLVTWSLAAGVFPAQFKDLSPSTHWAMGVAGAVGLFGSIVLHELAHSVVALRCGIPMKRITLFIFGGVAEMGEEPKTAQAELLVAIAGPIMSLLIAAVCLVLGGFGIDVFPVPIAGVLRYLGVINVIIVIFNLIPAFPLDGGRVLRAILWQRHGDLTSATKITASMGNAFGMVLIFLGIFSFVTGNAVGGLWQFLIGLFLRNAAAMSYQHVVVKSVLSGYSVARFMRRDVVTVEPSTTLSQLVENYIYDTHHKLFPVTDGERLIGCVTTRDVKATPRVDWRHVTVADAMSPCSADNSIAPETEAMSALTFMSQQGNSRLMVVEDNRLVGIVTLKDLMEIIALRFELEDQPGDDRQ